jgi:chromosome segregation ATPase
LSGVQLLTMVDVSTTAIADGKDEDHQSVLIEDTTDVADDKDEDPQSAPIEDTFATPEKPEGPEPEMSTRERIRARMREQEKRLSSLVRSSSSDGSSYISQMKEGEANLKRMEDEKSELEGELNRLKNATDGDDFLKEKMSGIQEGFEKQLKRIQALEDEVLDKDGEIDHLQVQLMRKLHRVVELEFDLETHDVHYTSYASEQFKLGEDALTEIKSQEKLLQRAGGDSQSSLTGEKGSEQLTAKRAQKLISKLLADLDSLEARYKQEKLDMSAAAAKINMENEQLRLQVVKNQLEEGEAKNEDLSESASSVDMESVLFLRKRVETLEAKRFLHQSEMGKLAAELKHSQLEAAADSKKANHEVDRLYQENEASKARIAFLEGNLNKKSKKKDEPAAKDFEDIEHAIRYNYVEISKLEASLDIRDRQLGTMKKELGLLRMKEIGQGKTEGGPYSEFDTDLVRKTAMHKAFDDDQSGLTEPTDASFVQELKVQLRQAQQQLVKKDQELVIERAKAASTTAGLLARITDLSDKKRVDAKSPGGSQRRDSRRFKM